ncbi:hypothetical protein ACWEGQ_00270 [Streptomyces seoulensis]
MAQVWPEGRREAVCAWLTANDIDPNIVPVDGDLYLTTEPDGTTRIHYEAFYLDSQGHKHLNERGDEAAIDRRTSPLLVNPPDWWEPHRKPTRDQLLSASERVKQLHRRNEHTGDCEHCSARDYPDYAVPWPCPTVQSMSSAGVPHVN